MSYVRKEIYSVEEVLAKSVPSSTPKDMCKIDWDGDLIKMNSQRYEVFKTRGTTCVDCGIIGLFFAKERTEKCPTYHFNLYAIDEDGKEILMTKDHIIAKSNGGPNKLENYQTMCTHCNFEKGVK